MDDFGALIYREIDYRAEARNARQFAKLYQGYENTISSSRDLRRVNDVHSPDDGVGRRDEARRWGRARGLYGR